LIALSVIPALGGAARLMSVATDTVVTEDNARFLQAPTAVVVHALSATLYSLLGAFQFTRGYRARWPAWHRRAGKVLALAGLSTGLTGLWMTVFYKIPTGMQGPLLYGVRLAVGSGLVACIAIAWSSILKRQVARHEAFMIRAYALAQGAGMQAVVLLPWILSTGESTGLTRDLLMTLAWLINLVAAELVIRQRSTRLPSKVSSQDTPRRLSSAL
jgi:uncharacterized membrane protein